MAAAGAFSPFQVHEWLESVRKGWLALHYEDPDISGAYASEVFGGSYTRVRYEMSQPSNMAMFMLTDILYIGLPAVKVTHVAGWDDQNGGNWRWSAPLPAPHTVFEGKTLSLPAGTIALSLK